jgi:hypothetical protein
MEDLLPNRIDPLHSGRVNMVDAFDRHGTEKI